MVKSFTLLLLKPGSNPLPNDEALVNELQMGHLAHLFCMEEDGKSSVFGPVMNSRELNGMIIFNTIKKDDIDQWMADDPYVKAGHLTYELFDWFTIPGQKIPG